MLVRSPLLTSHKWRELAPSGRLVCRCHDVFIWYYVCFVLLRFSSLCFRCSRGPSFNRPSICRRPDSHTCFFFSFLHEMSLFPSIFSTISTLSLYGEYVIRPFSSEWRFSALRPRAGFCTSAYVRIQSINQSINQSISQSINLNICLTHLECFSIPVDQWTM